MPGKGMVIDMAETIAAIATAQAAASVGMVRVSGDAARMVCDRVFTAASGKKLADSPGYRAHYGWVADQGERFDEAVALVFAAPHSYTGEDVVELTCHGGSHLVRRLLQALLAAGARLAQPGEFTRRAFFNGKMDLAQAEAVMDLIGAQGEGAARAALAAREGALGRSLASVTSALTEAAAWMAAWADFPEEDIPAVDRGSLTARLTEQNGRLQEMLDRFSQGRLLREGVSTVIAGRPNAGKSALMNRLTGRDSSIVTHIAGTTRDVVEESVLLGQVVLRLADTAGLRETDDEVERIGVERTRRRLLDCDLVLAVFDCSRPLCGEDRELISLCPGGRSIAVVNKNDLPPVWAPGELGGRFARVVTLSALTGEGLEGLEAAVNDLLGLSRIDPAQGMLANERQRECLQRASAALDEAIAALQTGVTLDAVSVCLDEALGALLECTGQRVSDQVVDAVFHRFCVGK